MTAENEETQSKKSALCPLSCMGRRKKPAGDFEQPADPEEAPSLIEERRDESFDDPGYARLASMIQDQGETPRDIGDDVLDGSAEDEQQQQQQQTADGSQEDESEDYGDQEAVEEEIEATKGVGSLEASIVYAQVNKPTAPSFSGDAPLKSAMADGVPTPRSAASPPAASQRSAPGGKRVNFNAALEAGPSAPPPVDLGAFGDVMQRDLDDSDVAKAKAKAKEAPFGGQLLPGVSLNSYGLASMSVDQSHESPQRSYASDQSVETQNLKKTIRRLTSELSRQLMADDGGAAAAEGRKLLPGKGPVPPWLCDSRVFSPLLAAYDERLAGRSQAADRCEAKLQALELRIKDVVKENERLRLKLREAQTAGPSAQTEWDVFTEQARLVLEENQLMIQQLGLQQEKAQQSRREHTAERAKLHSRIEELQSENAEAKEEFDRLRAKLHEVKSKYQSAVMDREDQDLVNVDRVKALSRELQEVREHHKEANNELLRQLQAAERERVRLTESLADAVAEKEKLRVEVEGLKELLQSKHRDNLLLQKFAKKHSSLKKYLDSVINEATNLQNERDSYKATLEAQEKEFAGLSQQVLADLHSQSADGGTNGKMLHSDEDHADGVKKLQRLIQRLLELLKDNEARKEEAEKQVKYLQSLLKQKAQELQMVEAEKRDVDEELEVTWRRAAAGD